MKKVKKNWLIIIIGMHIAFRIVLSNFVTNDEVSVVTYKATAENNDTEQELLDKQIVLLD